MGILPAGIVNSLSGATLTSACEKDLFLSAAANAILPKNLTVYSDVKKMLPDENPQAAFVTTSIDTHVEDLLKTEPNLNVFVEKPLAFSHEQARLQAKPTMPFEQ
jgi:predicted dehydrogenase